MASKKSSRSGRDNGGDKNKNSRAKWWNAGHHVPSTDNQRGANEGLSAREIRALAEENTRPWGMSSYPRDAIARRARRGGNR
jgi:hypothetical protein